MSSEHGIKPEYMDLETDPGTDFYRYATGTYTDTAELPAGYPRWGSFLELRELSLNRLHDLMVELSTTHAVPGTNERRSQRLEHYGKHIANMLVLLGERPAAAARHAETILTIEKALATASMPDEDQRDPGNIWHLMPRCQFESLVPAFSFDTYFS